MLHAFAAVVPVFLVILAGIALRSRDALPESTGSVLGVYVLRAALPLLILHLLADARPQDLANWGFWLGVIGSQLAVYALGHAGDRLLCRRGVGPAVISGLSCSACNAAFVGLPIVANLLPGDKEAMLVAGLAILTPNVVMILAQGRLDLRNGALARDASEPLLRCGRFLRIFFLGNPLLIATLLGMILAVSGLGLWAPLDRAASLVGHTAAPCMLLALGLDLRQKLTLARRRARGHAVLRQCWHLICKLLIHPLLCWAALDLLGIGGRWLVVGVLINATGTALLVTVMAEVYRAAPEEAALTAVLSNGISLFTLTGFVWLFQHLGLV